MKPNIFKSISNLFKQNNSIGSSIGSEFLKYGNRRPLVQDWSSVIMSDKDLYTGYSYAAINNRANSLAQIAIGNINTYAKENVIKSYKDKGIDLIHPYLDIIDKSSSFSNYQFWFNISTFLDLEGVYYILVVRTIADNRVGNVQEFKLLNPYNVKRIRNRDTGEIGGYIENRDGFTREIPPQMIIDIRTLNPFSADEPFALTDAAKEYQYTLKQAGDYTRHSLKNNMSAPGIISTDMLLDDEQFKNFVGRVTNQEKGLPLFGNGAGAINWDSMQIDLDKAALKDLNEINRSTLFAVSGVGKTMMSIEESGTTRETAKVQKDLFIEAHIIPQLQLIIDSLNQDYKRYYESEYNTNGFIIYIDNPLGTDKDVELKDIDIRKKSFEMYNSLVNKGYEPELSAKYASGEITLQELGQPTLELKTPIQTPDSTPFVETETEENLKTSVRVINEFEEEALGIVATQQSALKNDINAIEAQVVTSVINKISRNINQFEEQSDLINKKEREEYEKDLTTSLDIFYQAIVPTYATMFLSKRAKEFNLLASFKNTTAIKKKIKDLSKKVAIHHIDTILEDIRVTVENTYNEVVQKQLSLIEATGRKVTDRDLILARKKALEGVGQQEISSAIRKEYMAISKNRANTIARTEAHRAFTTSQFESDKQFLAQNNLEKRAYKKWVTFSSEPCPTCQELASRAPVPFDKNFANIGDTITTTYEKDGKTKVHSTTINFTDLEAGNAHPNCSCRYKLIIK